MAVRAYASVTYNVVIISTIRRLTDADFFLNKGFRSLPLALTSLPAPTLTCAPTQGGVKVVQDPVALALGEICGSDGLPQVGVQCTCTSSCIIGVLQRAMKAKL